MFVPDILFVLVVLCLFTSFPVILTGLSQAHGFKLSPHLIKVPVMGSPAPSVSRQAAIVLQEMSIPGKLLGGQVHILHFISFAYVLLTCVKLN